MSKTLKPWQALLLGIVVLAGLALAAMGIFALGSRQYLWQDTLQLHAGFDRIHGIEAGARVRVQGMEAGEVVEVVPPADPGGLVNVRMRLNGRFRSLIRTDATAQIVNEGMIGGKVIEITPGSATAAPVAADAMLASRPSTDVGDVLLQVNATLETIREGQGTVGKLLKDPEAYQKLVAALEQTRGTLAAIQQDAEALKRLPVVRNYVEDPASTLVRPNSERNRQVFAETDLFEAGRAVLTAAGRRRLDELSPWLNGLKHKGSEVVIAAYADPSRSEAGVARQLTRQQSEAIRDYLKDNYSVQKMGWFSSRKVTPLGLGTNSPPEPEKDRVPPARVEIIVFVPQK